MSARLRSSSYFKSVCIFWPHALQLITHLQLLSLVVGHWLEIIIDHLLESVAAVDAIF